ncbi:Cdc6/Cdc18 family protein [Halolamina sp.]|uniref:Cdc6/Cdc18 family protein n=1 Tax=Halolamina sp. TaxID=1940283 RepID=UPI0035664E20
MFTRQEVFTESFLPNAIPGRSQELGELSDALNPATTGEAAKSCWEIGPSGVGKTSTARFLLEELRVKWSVRSTKVDCVGSTHWQLLSEIAARHPKVPQHQGMGTEGLRERLDANLEHPYVIVLDEFDGLEDPDLLVDLVSVEMVSLICIGHDLDDAHALVPNDAQSLKHASVVEFDPYEVAPLYEILDARRDAGLRRGAVSEEQLQRIAAEVGGSARYAVQALRSAVDLGEERGHTEVKREDVEDCFDHAKGRIRRQLLASLSRQHHLVYRVIREGDGLRAVEVFERYRDVAGDAKTRQMVTKYRDKLERYDLVERRGREWVAVDDTLKAPLEKPA